MDPTEYESVVAGRGALTSWLVKFSRADDHLHWLRAEMEWLQREQAAHLFDSKADPASEDVVIYAERPDPIPLRWQAVVGDCIQNLRSSLDHVVWRLAEVALNGQAPPHTTEFPIFTTRKLYARDSERKIGSLRPETKALIESLQPYNAGYKALWTLHELSRRDKHRALLLTALVLNGAQIRLHTTTIDFTETIPIGPLIAGAEIGRIPHNIAMRAIQESAQSNVDMKVDLPTGIAFNEPDLFTGHPDVLGTLATIQATVADAIDRMQGEFGIPNFRFPPGRT